MEDGRIFLKIFRASLFNDDISNERLISAEFISLDSTFKMHTARDILVQGETNCAVHKEWMYILNV